VISVAFSLPIPNCWVETTKKKTMNKRKTLRQLNENHRSFSLNVQFPGFPSSHLLRFDF
jgi:hypothetical protein